MRPRWVRVLLRFYSRSFRDRFGEELAAFWQRQTAEARYTGLRGRLRLILDLVRDAAIGGTAQRLRLRMGGGAPVGAGGRAGNAGSAGSDVRYALRSLRGAPVHAMVVVLTLGLGIGATTSIFSVVDGVLLRSLPYPDPDRLVLVGLTGEGSGALSWSDFRDWREQAAGFTGMAAFHEADTNFIWDDGAELLRGANVTRDLFEILGVQPMIGRTFTADEDRLDGPDAVILSWGLWQRRFGGDPGIIGRNVSIAGTQVPVIGVMPNGFAFPLREGEYWAPLQEEETMRDAGLPLGRRTLAFIDAVARVSPDVDVAVAEQNLAQLATRIDESEGLDPDRRPGVQLESLRESVVGDVRLTLIVLLGAVLMLLVVACANVAALTLSRTSARSQELAVRVALGAGRLRLVRQLLTESLVLAMAAAVLGIGLSWGLTRLIVALAPAGVPRLEEVGIGGSALVFAVLAALASGLAFGVVPAVRSTGGRMTYGLARLGRGSISDRRTLRAQQILVVFQVSLAVAMLAGALLLVRSYGRLMSVQPGYSTEGVIMASVAPSEDRYTEPEAIVAFYSELLRRVRALPGVIAATTTFSPPLMGNGFRTSIEVDGRPEDADARLWASSVIVRDGYFATTGTPLLRGRDFTDNDRLGSPFTAIISQVMADRFWPAEDPIGMRFRMTSGIQGTMGRFDRRFFSGEWMTVIGVAGDVRRETLMEAPEPEYYRPHSQVAWAFQFLMIRTDGDVATLTRQVRETVTSVDPTVPVESVRTIRSTVREAVADWRFRMLLVGSFGVVTCMLAMLGVYTVMALAVARRRKEMGLRLALGATAPDLLIRVLTRGLGLVAAGTLAGLAISLLGNRMIETMLFEIETTDPTTYVAVTALIATVALLACWIPARRASRTDPVRSLQQD